MNPVVLSAIIASVTPAEIGGATLYRYWRLRFQDGDNETYCSLSEVEFRGVTSGPALNTGGTAYGSPDRGGSWVKANAFDGNTSTLYSSTTDYPDCLLGYDFGAGNEVDIKEVMIRARPTFQSHTPWSWVLEASNDDSTYYIIANGGKYDGDWGASEEVVWTLDGTFETHHGRIGFQTSDTTHSFLGQDFETPLDIVVSSVVMRSASSGKSWSGGLFKLNASNEITEVSATFSGDPSNGGWTEFTLITPVTLPAGSKFMIGVRDVNDQQVRLNYIDDGDVYGFLIKNSTGWLGIADSLPGIGDTSDGVHAENGFLVYPKGTFTPGGP